MRVEDYGAGRIRPHERTHPGPKEDRLRLTRATQANLSPIFSLFSDPDGAAAEALERMTARRAVRRRRRSRGHAQHALARRPTRIRSRRSRRPLSDAELLIADGHHRYETARVYAEEIGGEGEHRYVLMFLCSLDDPGLTVFPTHRLLTGLKDDRAKQEAIRDVLMRDFDVRADRRRRARAARRTTTGVAFGYMDSLPSAALPA